MSEILLSEATTEQLAEALRRSVPSVVMAWQTADDRQFYTLLHGGYIEQHGLSRAIESKLRYNDYMCMKYEFDDDPEKYFEEN